MNPAPHDAPATSPASEAAAPTLAARLPGLLLTLLIAAAAFALGRRFTLVGGPVIGIVLGIVIANAINLPARLRPGIQFASKQVLQWSIIALGFGLSLDRQEKKKIGASLLKQCWSQS